MPFREVASFFQPEHLEKLNAAFDAAWQQLLVVNVDVGTEPQIESLRKKLAQHLIASACTGQRDVEMLTENALRALVKRHSTVTQLGASSVAVNGPSSSG